MRMLTISAALRLHYQGVLDLHQPPLLRWRGSLLYVAAGLAIHWGWWATRNDLLGGSAAVAARLVATVWSVAALVLVFAGIPFLLARTLYRLVSKPAPADAVDEARRRILGGAAVPVLALTTGAGGTVASLRPFEILEEEVEVEGLPEALDGFRIGQITDVHVGEFIDADHVRRAVEAMNAAGCDLQVMTGDLIDDLSQLDATFAALERCDARHGMLAVIGNHEIWRGEREVLEAYERSAARGGVRLLLDGNTVLEHDGARLHVVGVDYPMIRGGGHRVAPDLRERLMRASAEKAFTGVPAGETTLCLTHHPDYFPIAAERGAHLTLAGHTHGGQVALFGMPIFRAAYEFMLGRYRIGRSHLYVSGGTGHWFPFRVGVPAEVTVLTLRAARPSRSSRPRHGPARA